MGTGDLRGGTIRALRLIDGRVVEIDRFWLMVEEVLLGWQASFVAAEASKCSMYGVGGA